MGRYEKLTGKQPINEIRRLPNGEWTETPREKLDHMRETKLSNESKLSGSADFILVMNSDKVQSVRLVGGDNALEPLSARLKSARYPLEFPADSDAVLALRMTVNCRGSAACTAKLLRPTQPGAQRPPVY